MPITHDSLRLFNFIIFGNFKIKLLEYLRVSNLIIVS